MSDNPFDKLSRRQTLAAMIAAGMAGAVARPVRAADFSTFNSGYAEHVVLPAFANLVTASGAMADAAAKGCAAQKPDLAALRAGFHTVADAWADAQLFRLGPLAENQRAERFAYWPERRNIVDKQLAALLAAGDTADLTSQRLGDASVAVQGIPALERLLYREEALPPAGCAIILAIAGNLSAIAIETEAAWAKTATDPAPFAANPTEAATQFYTNMLTLLQVVADQKIGQPLGGDIAAAKPKAAEQWRSGRSARNIRRNLAAAQAAFFGDGGFTVLLGAERETLKANLSSAFADAIAAADAVGEDLPADVVEPARRDQVATLYAKVNHLRDILRQDVPPVIGITLGFNELDGDGS